MLTCHSCMKHCLQTLIGESALVSTSRGSALATSHTRRRNYTSRALPQSSPRHQKPIEREPNFTSHKPENDFKKGAISTSFNRQKWLESRGVTPVHKRVERQNDDLLMKKQLKYLKDPLKLAEHVRQILREDDFESAVAVVRAASKDTQCIVSWNHLIDWQLSRQKMNGAIKTYNEMKKRAQTPDAYTYTIIFRGCADHPEPAQALAKVITIYNSMLTDKSPIKPNTIHMNSVLKMCAKAQDMDALFSIATHMPGRGPRAPNKMTYTIILNAIRINTFVDLRGDLTPMQQRKNRQKANLDARLLWEDITKRWLQGDIMIDEELACTMGRVLLLGADNDIDDILSLIEQTMNIPRQTPRMTSPQGQERDPRPQGYLGGGSNKSTADLPLASKPVIVNNPERVEADPIQSMANLRPAIETKITNEEGQIEADSMKNTEDLPSVSELESASKELSVTVANPFKATTPPKNLTKKGVTFFAKPGQNTLSLLMSALLDLRQKAAAAQYWNIITKDYQVEPDADNYHGYLRILRQARASTETIQLLLQMPQSYMATKTFRIAMSTCDRDKNNQHCFSNAGKVLDLMQTRLQIPDFQVLYIYLDIACSATAYSGKVSSNGEHAASQLEKGKQILRALYRINSSYTNLRSLLAYGDPTKPEATFSEKATLADAVLTLTQRMVSAYDLVMNKAMVDRTKYTELTKERSKLAAFITRFKHKKNGIIRPTSGADIISESPRFLRRATNPELQRKQDFAKQEGRLEEFMNDWADEVAETANEEEKTRGEKHSENARGTFTERFAEQERKAAEAAWPSRVVNVESTSRSEKLRTTSAI